MPHYFRKRVGGAAGILFLLKMGNFVEGLRQIAVVTKNGAVGEILSTALFAAGPEQRETLLASLRPLLVNHFLIGY